MTTLEVTPRRATSTIDGRRISYLEWGVTGNPVMVLLHGGNSAAADWQDVAAAFAHQWHVIAPDIRGRGFSDWDPAGDYTVAATVADMAAWRAQLGLERFALAGHSFGAVAALVYAAEYPAHVKRLVLLDGGPIADRSPADLARLNSRIADLPFEFASWDAVLEWQRTHNPAVRDELNVRLAENHFVRHADGHVTWRSDVPGQLKWSQADDPIMRDQWPFVSTLQCPTLVVRGGASPLFGAAIVERMRSMNARVTECVIAGAGHSVQHEKPAEVIAAMREFLA